MKFIKNIIKIFLVLGVLGIIFIWWANHTIEYDTEDYVTENINKLPNEKVGLVLGTSKTLKSGKNNPYFFYFTNFTTLHNTVLIIPHMF